MGYELTRLVSSVDLANALHLPSIGPEIMLASVAKPSVAESASILFVKARRAEMPYMNSLVIAPPDSGIPESCAHVVSESPRLDFIRALAWLNEHVGFKVNGRLAQIDATARVSPSAFIGKDVEIGAHTIVEPSAVIHSGVKIGSGCLIRAGADIGGDGFGYERAEDGTPIKFLHLASVTIGDRVEIGANTCVARGVLEDTLIDDDVKIDNLVHIAHNCVIRKGAFVIAGAEISGGVEIGEYAWIGPNAAVIQQVKIGRKATVGIGAVVTKDVAENLTVAGSPAQEISELIRTRKAISKISSMDM